MSALLASAVVAGLVGCRGDAVRDGVPLEMRVSVAPTPPIIGPARLVLTLEGPEEEPVEGARLHVEGTMAHAGMEPVLARAEEVGGGSYVVPAFDFNMGGDWVLIVRIHLPDGREVTRRHPLRVVSGRPPGGG